MSKTAYVLLALAVLALGAFLWFSPAPPPEEPVPTEPWTFALIEGTEDGIEENITYIAFDASYPQSAFINERIEALVRGLRDGLREELDGFPEAAYPGTHSLFLSPTLSLLDARAVSIAFAASTYVKGAAHPNNFFVTLTLDLEEKQEVAIGDLIRADAFPALARAVREEVEANYDTESFWLEDGLAPLPENFATFVLAPEGVVFLFSPYQLAAYAAGGQEAFIPYEELRTLAVPGSLLSRLAENPPLGALPEPQ